MPVETRQTTFKNLQNKSRTVSEKPGVYLFRDKNNRVLYVGKAKKLRSRLRGYFQKSAALDPRKSAMMKQVSDLEFTVTDNEREAFVLEANLIKQYKPRFNILLRDDKNYPYLKLTVNEHWPRIEVVRKIQKDGARYYGPYVPAGAMWETLSFIRNYYAIPSCTYSLDKRMRPCIQYQIKKCSGPCACLIEHTDYLNAIHEIQLLLEGKNKRLLKLLRKKMHTLSDEMKFEEAGVIRDRISAIQKITESQRIVAPHLGDVDVIGLYRKDNAAVFKILFVRNGIMIGVRDFFIRNVSGEHDGHLFKNVMEQLYEKKIIPPPEIVCSHIPEDGAFLSSWLTDKRSAKVHISVPKKGTKRKLIEMAIENARVLSEQGQAVSVDTILRKIAAVLHLSHIPEDIGAFDISNISGSAAVGSFVYWAGGSFVKDHYRHIKMEAIKGPDDYAMMREMIKRTFNKFKGQEPESGEQQSEIRKLVDIPDLIIIDGGAGQLRSAKRALDTAGIGVDVVSIAKAPDRVFMLRKKAPVDLEDGTDVSLLLRKIRDEAHRFALTYHRKVRSRKIFSSPLENIPGIGKKRRFALLKHFGSIEAIQHSSAEEIAQLKGLNRPLAEKILALLKRRDDAQP